MKKLKLTKPKNKRLRRAKPKTVEKTLMVDGFNFDGVPYCRFNHYGEKQNIQIITSKELSKGDIVVAEITKNKPFQIVNIKKIIKQKDKSTTNTEVMLLKKGVHSFVLHSTSKKSKDIIEIYDVNPSKYQSGDIVLVDMNNIKIIEKITDVNSNKLFMETVIAKYGYKIEFDENVEKIANNITKVEPSKNHIDYTHLNFVTIDGIDAKDFDDAVYVEKNKNGGYKSYIAIADVSHYVHENTALDEEAKKRGNSVYFPNYVIPMLPENICNNICSLVPNEDRLALVCIINHDENGKIEKYKFKRAVINSKARLTYEQVQDYIDTGDSKKNKILNDTIPNLHELYKKLCVIRNQRGVIELEIPENNIQLDDKFTPTKIIQRERKVAHAIIEEMMISANTCAANLINKKNRFGIHRVHHSPSLEKVNALNEYFKMNNIPFKIPASPEPSDFQKVLKNCNKNDVDIISSLILRTQSKAKYETDNMSGHFGLALDEYTHFTSPIRRYCDLVVHRIICDIEKIGDNYDLSENQLDEISDDISFTERLAMIASRELNEKYIAKYIHQNNESIYSARIVGFSKGAVFALIDDIGADIIIMQRSIEDDYYILDEKTMCLVGRRSKRIFNVGQKIDVEIAKISPIRGDITGTIVINEKTNNFEKDTRKKSSRDKNFNRSNKVYKNKR